MGLMISNESLVLWQDAVKTAEDRCAITLHPQLESYLVTLLMRYANQPGLVHEILADSFLHALSLQLTQRKVACQMVGDQCLLFAGLYPRATERKHVNLSYFVDLGRSAYANVSNRNRDLFGSLAIEFVVLMDVLQSIPSHAALLPLEAYEQWTQVGSQRAFRALQEYTQAGSHKGRKS